MGSVTQIAWTHSTYNPWRGCEKISPGCQNCYAKTLSERNPLVLGHWGKGTPRVCGAPDTWHLPDREEGRARTSGRPRRMFCLSLGDFFEQHTDEVHDHKGQVLYETETGMWVAKETLDVPGRLSLRPVTLDDLRLRVLDQIRRTPHVVWQILTKRADQILPTLRRLAAGNLGVPGGRLAADWIAGTPPPNVHLGVSAETLQQCLLRGERLLDVPAALRWFSMEPLLDRVDVPDFLLKDPARRIGWVVVGGESDSTRPCHVEWVRAVRDRCRAFGVPVFVKQLGSTPIECAPNALVRDDSPQNGRLLVLKHKKGEDPREWPADLRVQEFPA